jgi:hypothetical protein
MTFARLRLGVALALFAGWVGWLGVQAFTRPRDPILSHAQFLVSTLDVIATVEADADGKPKPAVTVVRVHWPPDAKADPQLEVANLPSCAGFTGPGEYVLALVKRGEEYQVAGPPRSPGFEPLGAHGRPVIYPATPEVLRQLALVPKPPADRDR